ncbi:hypothetical protein K4074_004737 [Salmonella enterica]|nr:hypothetical protein [Salmonella enterica]EEE4212276.1 hypothetical protein [Salmonella enterica subsp. enterica serovar Muenchen]EEU8945618.1 hypothetical protein [Salmonella enterica]EFR0447822.1 hypothetical protein [Salmonella enterica]EHF0238525.1 hypothetical protein [Salmonella enterica]
MRGAHGRRNAPEAPQRKARGLKKRYGFSRNNPPPCKAILSTVPAATPRPDISPVPVSGLCGALRRAGRDFRVRGGSAQLTRPDGL